MSYQQLYDNIIKNISKSLFESLEDIEFNGKHLKYNNETGKYEDADKNELDEMQKLIVSLKTKEDIIRYFDSEAQKVIDTDGKYAQEYIDKIIKLADTLNITNNLRDVQFDIVGGQYISSSYEHIEKWSILKAGDTYTTGYDNGDFEYRKTCKKQVADKNMLYYVYKYGTNYGRSFYGSSKFEHTVSAGTQMEKDLLKICKAKNYTDLYKLSNYILDARVEYMKKLELFDTGNADKLYVRYGVSKMPTDWFAWAGKYIPLYVTNNGCIHISIPGWYGGIDNIYINEKGRLMVHTYMTNDHSDFGGDDISFTLFNENRKLYYKEESGRDPYICEIAATDKIDMYEEIFNYIKHQIDLGNIKK